MTKAQRVARSQAIMWIIGMTLVWYDLGFFYGVLYGITIYVVMPPVYTE